MSLLRFISAHPRRTLVMSYAAITAVTFHAVCREFGDRSPGKDATDADSKPQEPSEQAWLYW